MFIHISSNYSNCIKDFEITESGSPSGRCLDDTFRHLMNSLERISSNIEISSEIPRCIFNVFPLFFFFWLSSVWQFQFPTRMRLAFRAQLQYVKLSCLGNAPNCRKRQTPNFSIIYTCWKSWNLLGWSLRVKGTTQTKEVQNLGTQTHI